MCELAQAIVLGLDGVARWRGQPVPSGAALVSSKRRAPATMNARPVTPGPSAGRRTMAEREARIDRLLLGPEIADFLYREAELLDQRRFREWLRPPNHGIPD